MFKPDFSAMYFIGLSLEGFFYGLYSGLFALYLHCQASKEDISRGQNIVFYSLCALYVLSVIVFACDVAYIALALLLWTPLDLTVLELQQIAFGCCDFIAQFILIYRCWIVWGCNIRVVIIPSILAFIFLATWLVFWGKTFPMSPKVAYAISLSDIALPLILNLLVTGLIVFRIFKVFREVKATSDDQMLGATGGRKLRCIIFILIESGMALFSIQLARLVLGIFGTDATSRAYRIIAPIHQIITGITPTIILVRTSMGLSFGDKKSIEEVAIESLRFAPNHLNSVPETGSISIAAQDRSRDINDDDVQRSNRIDVVER